MNMAGYHSTIYSDAAQANTGSMGRSIKQGGTQLDYADEDPALHEQFHQELAQAGIACRMAECHPHCSLRMPAKAIA
jgi:hypothetical protein